MCVGRHETGAGCSALSLVELAEFAKARDAVIFLSVGGQVGRSGQLQQFLTEEGISFTGPGALPCMTCADRVSPHPSTLSRQGKMNSPRLVGPCAVWLAAGRRGAVGCAWGPQAGCVVLRMPPPLSCCWLGLALPETSSCGRVQSVLMSCSTVRGACLGYPPAIAQRQTGTWPGLASLV